MHAGTRVLDTIRPACSICDRAHTYTSAASAEVRRLQKAAANAAAAAAQLRRVARAAAVPLQAALEASGAEAVAGHWHKVRSVCIWMSRGAAKYCSARYRSEMPSAVREVAQLLQSSVGQSGPTP